MKNNNILMEFVTYFKLTKKYWILPIIALLFLLMPFSVLGADSTIDAFNRSDRTLNGDTADNGGTWTCVGTSVPSIVSNEARFVDTGINPECDLDIMTLSDNSYNLSVKIKVSGTSDGNYFRTYDNGLGAHIMQIGIDSSGLRAFNGDGVGGGTWVTLAARSTATWYTFKIVNMNFTTHKFDVMVGSTLYTNGGAHFGFQTNVADIEHIDNIGFGSTTYIDEIILIDNGGSPPVSANFTISSNINTFNASIDGVNYGTTNGFIETHILQNATQLYNITLSPDNFLLNGTILNLNVSSDYQYNFTYLTINATDSLTGALISDINTNLSYIPQSFNKYKTNNTGQIIYALFPNYNYSLNITSPGYNPQSTTLNFSGDYTKTFILESLNSVYVSIYNATSLNLIMNSVSISFEGTLNNTYTNTTTTGQSLFYNLTPDTYTVTVSSSGYETSTYSVTVGENTFQNLNAYLDAETGYNVIFTFKDSATSSLLEGVTFTTEKKINSTYTVVDSSISDISGRVQIGYDISGTYRFTTTYNNYETKQFVLDPVIFNSYTVRLDKNISVTDTQDNAYITYNLLPGSYKNNQLNNFSFTISSPTGKLLIYGYNISFPSSTVSGSGNNVYGSTLTNVINITGASVTDKLILNYYYQIETGELKQFTKIYGIQDVGTGKNLFVDDVTFNMPLLDRVIVALIVILVTGGLFVWYSGIIPAGVVILSVLAYFGFIGFLPVWIVMLSSISIFGSIAWGVRQ